MENRIGERIKESGFTQKDFAEKMGITAVGLNRLARGTMPKIETFAKIAEALEVPVWSLLLSDGEIEEIRALAPKEDKAINEFRCSLCGAKFKVVLADTEE